MKKLVVFILMLLCVCACAKKESGKTLATIDGETITLEEFNKELDRVPLNMKMMFASPEGKKTYLERMIMKRLLLKEAKKEKIESEKEYAERLSDIKEQLLIEMLLKKKITKDVKVTDQELKEFYDKNKEQFKRGREINTRHILLKTEDEAKQVLERINKGEDFVELARTYSIDPNAKTSGGVIGFHPQGTLVKEYEDAAMKLKKAGDISGIVKTQFGYHIIRLEGVKPPAYVPFEEVKDFLKQRYVQEKQTEMIETYIEELKKNAKITKYEDLLKSEEKTEAEEKPAEETKEPAKKPEPAAKTEPAKQSEQSTKTEPSVKK